MQIPYIYILSPHIGDTLEIRTRWGYFISISLNIHLKCFSLDIYRETLRVRGVMLFVQRSPKCWFLVISDVSVSLHPSRKMSRIEEWKEAGQVHRSTWQSPPHHQHRKYNTARHSPSLLFLHFFFLTLPSVKTKSFFFWPSEKEGERRERERADDRLLMYT